MPCCSSWFISLFLRSTEEIWSLEMIKWFRSLLKYKRVSNVTPRSKGLVCLIRIFVGKNQTHLLSQIYLLGFPRITPTPSPCHLWHLDIFTFKQSNRAWHLPWAQCSLIIAKALKWRFVHDLTCTKLLLNVVIWTLPLFGTLATCIWLYLTLNPQNWCIMTEQMLMVWPKMQSYVKI